MAIHTFSSLNFCFYVPVVTKVKTHTDLAKDTNFINIPAKDSWNTFIAEETNVENWGNSYLLSLHNVPVTLFADFTFYQPSQ